MLVDAGQARLELRSRNQRAMVRLNGSLCSGIWLRTRLALVWDHPSEVTAAGISVMDDSGRYQNQVLSLNPRAMVR